MSEKNSPNRPVRIPLGARNVLTAKPREGYVRKFVNDVGSRVAEFEAAGYSVVRDEEVGDRKAGKETQVGSVTNPKVGAGSTAVLMEIKQEWFEEDKKKKQDEILRVENEMKRNLNTHRPGDYGEVKVGT